MIGRRADAIQRFPPEPKANMFGLAESWPLWLRTRAGTGISESCGCALPLPVLTGRGLG
jgi:hypothetical protein